VTRHESLLRTTKRTRAPMKESQKIVVIHQLDDKALDNDPRGDERTFLSSLPNDYHEPLIRPEYTNIGILFV
jgi:hypothetical protein